LGVDVRDIPIDEIGSLPLRLRELGYEVTVSQAPGPAPAGSTLTKLECRRGSDVQSLSWVTPEFNPGIIRIYIHNQGGWWPWVRRRRFQLQADVTQSIEELGGYWPYSD